MADRSIVFAAPMIQALLAGRKSQTRRLARNTVTSPTGPLLAGGDLAREVPSIWQHAVPGDRVWVRESFSGVWENQAVRIGDWPRGECWYWADGDPEDGDWTKPRSPRFMPRWASRLTLALTEVRVQRLQDITEADALAEGVVFEPQLGGYHVPGLAHPDPEFPVLLRPTAREMFAALWDTLHGGGAWLGNPEVVPLSFTTELRNIDA